MKPSEALSIEDVTAQNIGDFTISKEDFLQWSRDLSAVLPKWSSTEHFHEFNPWQRWIKGTEQLLFTEDSDKECSYIKVKDALHSLHSGEKVQAFPLQRFITTVLRTPAPSFEVDL